MSINKQQYWRYSLIAIITVLAIIIAKEILPFIGGLFGAFTIYILVRKQMRKLTEKHNLNRSLAAFLILGEVILCFLIPVFLVFWLLVNRLGSIDLEPTELIKLIQHFADLFEQKTGYNILSSSNLETLTSKLTDIAQIAVGQIGSFVINSIVLVFVLYFMLIGSTRMETYIYDILPFSENNKKRVLSDTNVMVRSNAIGIPLLALIQGFIAMIGYIIFGAPDPVLFAFITCFATIVPLLGTSLVWFPLASYLALSGNWTSAIGLACYALIVLTNVDNVVRFILQKKMSDTHPLVTIFGVIIGLSLFGFWGVIFGPLLLSTFLLCFDICKREYIDNQINL